MSDIIWQATLALFILLRLFLIINTVFRNQSLIVSVLSTWHFLCLIILSACVAVSVSTPSCLPFAWLHEILQSLSLTLKLRIFNRLATIYFSDCLSIYTVFTNKNNNIDLSLSACL